jgi:hypothetical protein
MVGAVMNGCQHFPLLPAPQPESRARRVGPMHYNLFNQAVPLRDGVPAQ